MNLSKPVTYPKYWWDPDFSKHEEEENKRYCAIKDSLEAHAAGFDILDSDGHPNVLTYRYKDNPDEQFEAQITSLFDNGMSLGADRLSYKLLFEKCEWFNGETWKPFGILPELAEKVAMLNFKNFKVEEETKETKETKEEKESERKKKKEERNGITKFKVGHKYYCKDKKYFTVLDKFSSPTDGQVYVVIEIANLEEILIEPYLVYRRPVGDEYIWIKDHDGKTHLAFACDEKKDKEE